MRKIVTLLVLTLAFLSPEIKAQTVTRLIGCSPFQDSLWVFDSTNINVIRRVGPTPNVGGSLTGMNGMAKNPLSGTIYVVNKQSAVSGRVLGKLDPFTGVVTIVGNLGDNFSSITFTSDGKLYGVTGDGATVPETLYQIDTATAAKRLVKTLGNGIDGEVICYNPDDNMIYHWSGNGTVVFEKMDTVTGPYNFISIPIIGTTNGETFGMVYRGNGVFIGSNIGSRFQLWTTTGNVYPQFGNTAPDDIRGTVLVTCSRAISGSQQFCTGGSTTLTSGANYFVGGYQWYLNGTLIPSAAVRNYVATAPGHYNCMVTDIAGTDSSGTGIDIVEVPLPVLTLGNDTTVCGTHILDAQNVGSTYLWNDNSTSQTITATTSGTYSVTVTDANGCSTSDAIALTVNPLPVVNLGPDASFCGSTTLDAQNAGSTYLWNDNSTTQTQLVTASGNYDVTVTNSFGCQASDGIAVTINALPVVNLGNDTATCGSAITLGAQNSGATYLWNTSQTTQSISATTSGTYSVLVTDANGCTNSDSLVFTLNPNPTVTATTLTNTLCINDPPSPLSGSPIGGAFSGPGVLGVTFTPSTAGAGTSTIYYMYTDTNGCSGSDSLDITVIALPNVSVTASSNTVCFDDANVTLTGSPVGGTFSGPGVTGNSFDPSAAGNGTQTITYTYSDSIACTNSATTQITVSACVGIAEHGSVNGTTLFPNPSNGNVQISLNDVSVVTIFNALGESVMTVQLNEGTHQLDLTGFAEGMYVVRTENSKGVSTQRLILNR